jgi:hypothetical protein
MLCVQRLTRGAGPAANAVSGAAPWRPASAIVLPDGEKTPYNFSTMIDPHDVMRVLAVCMRSGILDRLQQPARLRQHQPACDGGLEGPRCRMRLC